jgi:hypothetical protein
MKLILTALIALSFAHNALAGDAGYSSETCHSASKRTVLTQLSDYSAVEFKDHFTIYTLVVDGVPAVYNTSDANISVEGDDGYLTIMKDGQPAFGIQKPEGTITILQDPRKGTIAEMNATATPLTVNMTCKFYWPEP